jgi:hypothetical protein
MFRFIKELHEAIILPYHRAATFIVLISFLLTFLIARTTVYLIDMGVLPDFYVSVGQNHVHHLNFGIFALAISGYLALVTTSKRATELLSVLFGIGLGLTFDEFALWLFLNNDYYARASYEAIIVITVILLNIIYFSDLWKRIFIYIFRHELRPWN